MTRRTAAGEDEPFLSGRVPAGKTIAGLRNNEEESGTATQSVSRPCQPQPGSYLEPHAPGAWLVFRAYTMRLFSPGLPGTTLTFCSPGPAGLAWYRRVSRARLQGVLRRAQQADQSP